jgi:hypothetical protein
MRERHQRQLRGANSPETDPDDEELESDGVFVPDLDGEDDQEGVLSQRVEAKDQKKESVHTVAELLVIWAEKYETSEDEAEKRELSYKILKMEMALNISKLDAQQVKIRREDDDTLGLYNPGTGEVAITEKGLELPPEHFADVFVHEQAHKGGMTGGRRLMDEGVAEMLTLLRLGGAAMQDIYEKERQRLKDTFGAENVRLAIEKYDYDAPRKLATWYLETELGDKWDGGLQRKYKAQLTKKPGDEAKVLQQVAGRELKATERLFKRGVPDLCDNLKQSNPGFFRQTGLKILERLSK